jgi:hypothetical protein
MRVVSALFHLVPSTMAAGLAPSGSLIGAGFFVDPEFEKLSWSQHFIVAFLQFALLTLACQGIMIVVFFKRREISAGLLSTLLTVVCFTWPLGLFLTLLHGWLNALRWKTVAFMTFLLGHCVHCVS